MDYGSEARAHKAGTVIDERLDSGLDSLREDDTEDYCSSRDSSVVDDFARLNVDGAHEERWRTEITEDGDTCVVTLIISNRKTSCTLIPGCLQKDSRCCSGINVTDTVRAHSGINTYYKVCK